MILKLSSQKKRNETIVKAQVAEIVLYIVRHGKTMLNATERFQGWIDAPLTPQGISVAESLGRGFIDVQFDAVYSSDSGRALETATLILKNNKQQHLIDQVVADKRLREFNFGTFEGLSDDEVWNTVAREQGLTFEEWQTNLVINGFVPTISDFANTLHELDVAYLEVLGEKQGVIWSEVSWIAENYQTVVNRIEAVLNDIVRRGEEKGVKNILLVSHGMTIATLLSLLDNAVEIPEFGLENASVCKVVYKTGSYTIEAVNDLSYVEKGSK